MQYILKLEGQDIPLSPEVAASEQTIRNAIAPFFPDATTAEIKREEADGITVIRLAKKAGTKGNVMKNLATAENQLNPAIALSWQLKMTEIKGELTLETLLGIQPVIQTAIEEGEQWQTDISRAICHLKNCQSMPSIKSIIGI
ncbi:hypothetical protein [Aerosakkonema funiforme]|uniref:hypothetical protein n=1 Tax=Aerosakkonema funiforme TaxID=1246630 RepID=UPI0035B6B5B6